jgi:putative DNA primase/helicase
MSAELATVLDRLTHVRRSASGHVAYCPVHEADGQRHRPSLSIGVGRDGRILLHCFAGCPYRHIVAALGLADGALRTKAPAALAPAWITLAQVEAAREYIASCIERLTDPEGRHALGYLSERFAIGRELASELLLGYDPGSHQITRPAFCGRAFSIARLVVPVIVAGGFTGFQARAIGTGQPRWAGPTGSGWGRVGLLAAHRLDPIILCEGPADALAVVGAGRAAAFVRGAGLCQSANTAGRTLTPLLPELAHRVVIVAGDGDKAGRLFTRETAGFLRFVGVATRECDPGDGLDLAAIRYRHGSDALQALLEEARDAA